MITGLSSTVASLSAAADGFNHSNPVYDRAVDALMGVLRVPEGEGLKVTEASINLDRKCRTIDLGFAHGYAGLLTSAALGAHGRKDITADLNYCYDWFVGQSVFGRDGTGFWPNFIASPRDDHHRSVEPQLAWCYGSPGCIIAAEACHAAISDPGDVAAPHDPLISSLVDMVTRTDSRHAAPTLCHGTSGVLLVLLAVSAGRPTLRHTVRPGVEVLLSRILNDVDPSLALCVRDVDNTRRPVDDPSVLNGAAGVALTLLAATSERRPRWLDAFVPSGCQADRAAS